ncbi:Coenzyme F420 hydrogenase/dehydrogenase, beta subunit C-terminal domain [Mediterraneibacter glycyrrhizinilyticus]|uniref:Coenzyme F420 hydrogenase/dehydrogenase, beta subunit C-terminal domain n=1 Tax=Mediterraneibacter glycyrrhizinilyticus TaxID=342942 RepID=UPI0025A36B61|nr:Coenzyme F420 hydrogenase/dehydrogenase, beta subunit C-terminal domain [Mediterraneibacter glycyrrhizinilyticus]MDM8125538.1 Coenzyme F420 hydrogenase/dehydrogenase, beta subunit C-terminal domain [Mediterraneibacter glycyrrhizinilyticus]
MEHSIQLYKDKKDCCGCGSCLNACPKNAIEMKEDAHGFRYPVIDPSLCVVCGLCKKVCAFQNETKFYPVIKTYVAVDTDEGRLLSAASGGIFSSIASAVVRDKGVAFGSAWKKTDNTIKAVHLPVQSEVEIKSLSGSKYVQSDTSQVFSQVKDALKGGRTVLFSGTPCQVDALKAFLQYKEYENLYTIDLICHGVPSGKMFSDYLSVLEDRPVESYTFRDKKRGWGLQYAYQYAYQGKLVTKRYPSDISSYYHHFLLGNTYRENCYQCKYAKEMRCGDITIGDYWGIEKEHPELVGENSKIKVGNGVSCILVNSPKGQQLLERFGKDLLLFPSEISKVSKWNRQLKEPSKPGKQRDYILQLYEMEGWAAVEKAFEQQRGLKYKLKKLMYCIRNRLSDK